MFPLWPYIQVFSTHHCQVISNFNFASSSTRVTEIRSDFRSLYEQSYYYEDQHHFQSYNSFLKSHLPNVSLLSVLCKKSLRIAHFHYLNPLPLAHQNLFSQPKNTQNQIKLVSKMISSVWLVLVLYSNYILIDSIL